MSWLAGSMDSLLKRDAVDPKCELGRATVVQLGVQREPNAVDLNEALGRAPREVNRVVGRRDEVLHLQRDRLPVRAERRRLSDARRVGPGHVVSLDVLATELDQELGR